MIYICPFCGVSIATQRHHCLSQTKPNRKTYGKLLDASFNIMLCCADCHTSHAHVPKKYIWTEKQFRKAAKRAGYDLPSPKKSYKGD